MIKDSHLQLAPPNVRKMSGYVWNAEKSEAAMLLAEGYTHKQVSEKIGKTDKTIYRWLQDIEFSSEVDRLSLMVGIASKADRLRLVKRVIRQKGGVEVSSDKDILDWLKFAQSETDGIKLDIASLLTAVTDDAASVAGSGHKGSSPKSNTN